MNIDVDLAILHDALDAVSITHYHGIPEVLLGRSCFSRRRPHGENGYRPHRRHDCDATNYQRKKDPLKAVF